MLTTAGLHVPEILLVEVSGKTGAASILQMGARGANTGVAGASIVKEIFCGTLLSPDRVFFTNKLAV